MAHHPHPVHTHGVPDAATLTKMLEAAGYTGVTGTLHTGKAWHCTALDSTGKVVPLTIDGHGGIHLDTEIDTNDAPVA